MQENWFQLIQHFNVNDAFVLATICATRGSTYQKTGTMMLISAEGSCTGLLSGGCLEADISLHAQQVLIDNKTRIINYDLKADSELLWGLGLGCDGAIDILLQPLTPANNHLDFVSVISAVQSRNTGFYCQKIGDNTTPAASYITSNKGVENLDKLLHEFNESLDKDASILVVPITPPIAVVICGAGPDAEPVAQLLLQMGWQVEIWDHRQQYLDQACFSHCQKKKIRPEQICENDFSAFDAAVVMTHNLESDTSLIEKAWQSSLSYIGVLGPKGRRNKLIEPIGLTQSQIQGRLYGPIGLDLGGRGPQAIALSIAAQIQQHFSIAAQAQDHAHAPIQSIMSYIYNTQQ